MHELSLAMEICRIAEAHVGPEGLPWLLEVGVEVGVDGSVEPDSLEFCLEALLSRPPFGRARPVLDARVGGELRVTYLEIDDDRPTH